MTARARIAAAWGLATLLAAMGLAGGPGLPADEAATLERGRQAAGLLVAVPADPGAALSGLAALSGEARRPLLAEAFHGFAAEGGERLGLGPLRGARLGAAAVAALLAALLALGAFDLGGAAAAALAPAVLWLSPRLSTQALLATPDLPGALLWLAAAGVSLRGLEAASRVSRASAGLWTGLLVGLAAAVRSDLWVLLPVLALHWLAGRLHLAWLAHRAPAPPEAVSGALPRRRLPLLDPAPVGVLAAALLGPVVATAAYPWLWADPLPRALATLAPAHAPGAPPVPGPLALAAAALPTPLLLLLALGLGHAVLRLGGALRAGDAGTVRRETLLLLAAGAPLGLAASGLAPRLPGLRPLLHALPLLALLGARALAAVAREAWPARRAALAAALAVLCLYPGLRAAVRAFPHGASAWGEAVGGAPGAASRGLPRQDGGEAVRAALDGLAAHAVPGARVRWLGVPEAALERYRRAGLLRHDLAAAGDDADVLVVARGAGSRDDEYQAWSALGSPRAVDGVYLDEVALVQVHARAGAWR